MKEDTLRWTLSGALVLVLFGAALSLVLGWPHPSAPPSEDAPAEALAIEIAPAPEAPKAIATERQAGPVQRRAAAATKPQRLRAAPVPAAPTPDPVAVAAAAPAAPSAAPAAAGEQTTAPTAVAAPTGDRYAATASAAAQGADIMATWQSSLLSYLKRYRRYPRQAERSHEEGVAWVRFAVDRQGAVGTATIQVSSGHEALDDEALRTVQRASPVPPPPASLPGDPVMVMVPVNFFLKAL